MNLRVVDNDNDNNQAVSLTATAIDEYAFADSNLTAAYVTLNIIPKGLFSNSSNLAVCEIFGDSITSIGDSAFSNCTALTSVSLPNCIAAVNENAFNGCTQLGNFNFGGISNI